MITFALGFLAGAAVMLPICITVFGRKVGIAAEQLAKDHMIANYEKQISEQNKIIEKVAASTASRISIYLEQWSNAYTN